jgi:hypothetical protein
MTGLPKIVLARLKAKSAAPQAAGTPTGPASQRGGVHPDANLLTAFVEKALPDRERMQVLTHVAQCADCREVVALTQRAQVDVGEPAHLPARLGWSVWPTLRWGALAAALGAMAIVVVLHPFLQRRQQAVSKNPTLQAARQAAPSPPTASSAAQPGAEAALAKGATAPIESIGEKAKLAKRAERHGDQNLVAAVARAEIKQPTVTLRAAARLPMTGETANALPVGADQETPRSAEGRSAGGIQFKSARPQTTLEPPAAPENAGEQISNESQAPRAAAPARIEAAAAAKKVRAHLVGEIATPAAAPTSPVAMGARMEAQAAVAGMASRREFKSPTAPLTPLWSISPKGQVQRSDGREKDWEEVRVDDNVTFRVIAASGREVWAGGSGGALYHSSDGGVNWKRVGLNSGESTVTETIIGIELRDPQHLTVSTASGQQWVTEDGGQHWQGQP